MPCSTDFALAVGARGSSLSRSQVKEVEAELQKHYPNVTLTPIFVSTIGDRDKKTSLRTLEKSDFFTREIDQMLLKEECRVAIHSAKDLPDPLPEGLVIVALTKGVDSSDSLVFREGENLANLPLRAKIATSSSRREENVRILREDLTFIDVRGTIEERLELLNNGSADGVIVAEAALIRLQKTDLNRITLPGETASLQGKLAVLARKEDREMADFFRAIDTRVKKRILYLGLDPSRFKSDGEVIHFPIIRIVPKPFAEVKEAFEKFNSYTHILITSQSTFPILMQHVELAHLKQKKWIIVGKATAALLKSYGIHVDLVAENECGEGVIEILKDLSLENAHLFFPHSALARALIHDFLQKEGITYKAIALYDTYPNPDFPDVDFDAYDEVVFTSPSTVAVFFQKYGRLPEEKKRVAIGPITCEALCKHTLSKNS